MKVSSPAAAAALALLFGVGASTPALATSIRQKQAFDIWHKQDVCAHDAFLKFPDYTPESNANRDRFTATCEEKNRLPPRPAMQASPVKHIPDADAE